jgi:hypothetical protein
MSKVIGAIGVLFILVVLTVFAVQWSSFSSDEENLRVAVFNKAKGVCLSGGNSVKSGLDWLDALTQLFGIFNNISDPSKALTFCDCYANAAAKDIVSLAEHYRLRTIFNKITGGMLYPSMDQQLTEDMRTQWTGRPQVWNAACKLG